METFLEEKFTFAISPELFPYFLELPNFIFEKWQLCFCLLDFINRSPPFLQEIKQFFIITDAMILSIIIEI